ncbi:hypothetical protein U9M48_023449 [Paspalum notatum var. saurae]|uniref:Uncharacterized protein n=1 Tax=Paspalum notatum var. saurae TaxID=547442 RepID=A0AAQ3WW49_PASNO
MVAAQGRGSTAAQLAWREVGEGSEQVRIEFNRGSAPRSLNSPTQGAKHPPACPSRHSAAPPSFPALRCFAPISLAHLAAALHHPHLCLCLRGSPPVCIRGPRQGKEEASRPSGLGQLGSSSSPPPPPVFGSSAARSAASPGSARGLAPAFCPTPPAWLPPNV